ncbi:sigma-54-dependent Fis family transcriptional regulator [Xanthomonas hyacinthi]|uniref:Sigma-54-dependent Fis family transcriptional regulator n=1 Tax=Xanthomonas hyacinthi TaxID=56455 RepID=A0A2S7EPQ7_9XANT|nr:sigma-54 dependent transcriptional regulator [Xanthomonas hyacinthi]KLD74936.1 chemotaxis protein CheY [Xanthomonas hyacinthi DSM 19077]PPU94776.1 sigma-54-dependent Fis family transcriptional regulator [Xanthomonas hyacinthi]QGY77930.1 sigma-54-dependent Fis family transcriptional regulator [Xanthomonas hyacinthi]
MKALADAPRILVVDDQADVREALRMLLKSAGYGMVGAESPELALACLRGDEFAAVLVDMNYARDTTSGAEGLALIAQIAAQWPGLPVIAMTAWASIELAVAAMRDGAVDFIEKPWQNARVLAVLDSRIALDRSRRNAQRLGEAQALLLQDSAAGFVAESAPMQRLVEDLLRIAGSGANVLLLGENGTGKSLLAQLLHQWSPRRAQAFVKVNIGGLAPTLFEAELFGHVRGAYTDARQDRAGRFELAAGNFRQDLLYRLNTFQLRVPPLRERGADILPLARHYLAAACTRYRRPLPVLARDAERALLGYAWPGNVRELAHAMERAALLADGATLGSDDLRLQPAAAAAPALSTQLTLEEAEALLLRQALAQQQGNLQRTADQLGITRQSLYRRLGKHGLRSDDGG